METKKIDLNEGKKQKKEGVNEATVAMAGAGIAAAGVVGVKLFDGEDEKKTDETANVSNESQTETQQQEQAEVNEQSEPQHAPEQPVAQPQQANVQEPTPIAPDQPGTTATQTTGDIASTSTTTTTVVEPEPLDPSEAEALAIAQHLVGEDEVDLTDIDAPSLAILDTDIIYDEEGNEVPVAQVSVPGDSDTYLLADIDGDRVYDYVIDSNGTIVDMVQSGLNVDDAELALSGEAGYLAVNEESIQHINAEDISDDITILGTPEPLDYPAEELIEGTELGYVDVEPDVLLDDSDLTDDILTETGYLAPDEV